MPLKFNREIEQRQDVQETNDRYLASLVTAFAAAKRRVDDDRPNPFRHHFLSEFPDLIYRLSTAVHQRQEDVPYRFFTARIPQSRVFPSEVTLEYAVTIRAAEAVSDHYHGRLQHFYPPETNCRAPLVTLSGGPVAMLRTRLTLCRGISPAATQIPISVDALLRVMEHCQNLSCIKLPRWSSQHIRTYALAAHEHMHRVLDNAAMLTGAAKEAFEDARKRAGDENTNIDAIWFHERLTDDVKKRAQSDYMALIEPYMERAGNDLTTFALATYEFFQELWRFYREQLLTIPPPAASDRDCDALQAIREAEEQFWNLRGIAHYHALELLADVGAVLIAGPAFAFAFRTLHPISDPGSVAWGSSSHPPTGVRVRFHIDLLRRLGFDRIPALLEDDLATESTSHGDGHLAGEERYREFLASAPVGTLIDDFISHLTDATEPTATYNLMHQNAARADAEGRLISTWMAFAKQVEEEGAVLAADVTSVSPADAINAIWWKRIEEQDHIPHRDPRNRLAWRVALRNHGRLEDKKHDTAD